MVLKLRHNKGDGKYYIASQNDLYQVDQWIRFILPGGWALVYLWHAWASLFSLLGTYVLWPVTWVEECIGWGRGNDEALRRQRRLKVKEWRWLDPDRGGEREVVAGSELKGKLVE